MKRRCLICRLGTDGQKVEPLEVLAPMSTVMGDPESMPGIRVPLCVTHKNTKWRVLHVFTGES